ncbi:hypothetical protein [Lacibacter sediminis]|uniref:Uncharacterized protein n=1 Tax=Lacibacter sediminis TaxID=2760713 RepID=A0A7G5XI36_9BACT|nr:hypothetical protein [Lacibacter sediminis]QNA45139.1 hypothetical protein H4075_02770 [Lacibacter sediminis]
MKNILIPASFLAVALTAERKLLKTENQLLVIREEEKNVASRLYSLFFHEQPKEIQPAFKDEPISEPDYYSSYE